MPHSTTILELKLVPPALEASDNALKPMAASLPERLRACLSGVSTAGRHGVTLGGSRYADRVLSEAGARARWQLGGKPTPIKLALKHNLKGMRLVMQPSEPRLASQATVECWAVDAPEARPNNAPASTAAECAPSEKVPHSFALDELGARHRQPLRRWRCDSNCTIAATLCSDCGVCSLFEGATLRVRCTQSLRTKATVCCPTTVTPT